MAKIGGNPQKFLKHSDHLAERTQSVRLPVEIDAFVRSLPNRTEWLREAITEKYQREQQKQKSV